MKEKIKSWVIFILVCMIIGSGFMIYSTIIGGDNAKKDLILENFKLQQINNKQKKSIDNREKYLKAIKGSVLFKDYKTIIQTLDKWEEKKREEADEKKSDK